MEKTSGTAGVTILIDHDIEGKARWLWNTLRTEGWMEVYSVKMILFSDVGLAINSTDRDVWRFTQKNGLILLTGNRNMENMNSLEQTLRDENTSECLPVLTISKAGRLDERLYREKCAEKIMEIAIHLRDYLGTARRWKTANFPIPFAGMRLRIFGRMRLLKNPKILLDYFLSFVIRGLSMVIQTKPIITLGKYSKHGRQICIQ